MVFFVLKQHQWYPESGTEVSPRHNLVHVRVDDHVLGSFRRLHHSIQRLVEQHCHGVPRQHRRSYSRLRFP